MPIREAAVANQFYPGDRKMLRQSILEYIGKAEFKRLNGKLKALIAPHAGYIFSGPVMGSAYKQLAQVNRSVKWKVLLLGPAHFVPFGGAAAPVCDRWETPLGLTEVKDIRKELIDENGNHLESKIINDVPDANVSEHSLEVQVPFLQSVLKDFVLYPLLLGNVRPDLLAQELTEFCRRDDVIIVVSSDLSHYQTYEEAKISDMRTCEAILETNTDRLIEEGDACGIKAILALLYLAKYLGLKAKILDYKNSGDTAGDKNRVVGYSAFAFYK